MPEYLLNNQPSNESNVHYIEMTNKDSLSSVNYHDNITKLAKYFYNLDSKQYSDNIIATSVLRPKLDNSHDTYNNFSNILNSFHDEYNGLYSRLYRSERKKCNSLRLNVVSSVRLCSKDGNYPNELVMNLIYNYLVEKNILVSQDISLDISPHDLAAPSKMLSIYHTLITNNISQISDVLADWSNKFDFDDFYNKNKKLLAGFDYQTLKNICCSDVSISIVLRALVLD